MKTRNETDNVTDDVFRGGKVLWLGFSNVALEVGIGTKLFQGGTSLRVTEEILREEHDQSASWKYVRNALTVP